MPERSVSHIMQRITLALAALLAVALAPDGAIAQSYSITGNVRFQLGDNGLPIPLEIGSGIPPVPMGNVIATPAATAKQFAPGGGLPRNLTLPPLAFTAPNVPINLPIYFANPNAFEFQTSISAVFPASTASFRAGGRTGPPVATYVVPGVGFMRYNAIANQFGGPGHPIFGGTANIALVGGLGAPCSGATCIFQLQPNTPPNAFGGPLGAASTFYRTPPSPGAFTAAVTPLGQITGIGSPVGLGQSDAGTHFAGPWTTGRVTVSMPGQFPPLLAMITGQDNRTPGGLGTISLVSGGIVKRTGGTAGDVPAFGWLNITVVPEPSVALQVSAGLGMLALLAGLRRSRH